MCLVFPKDTQCEVESGLLGESLQEKPLSLSLGGECTRRGETGCAKGQRQTRFKENKKARVAVAK